MLERYVNTLLPQFFMVGYPSVPPNSGSNPLKEVKVKKFSKLP